MTAVDAMAQSTPVTLSTAAMAVEVDPQFPAVVRYTWKADGSTLKGRVQAVNQVVVNGTTHTPVSTGAPVAGGVDYSLRVDAIGLTVKARLSVSNNLLTFAVTEFQEGGEQVRTFAIPDQGLVSAGTDQTAAELAEARLEFNTAYHVENDIDRHTLVANAAVDASPRGTSYAIVNTSKLAAAVETNSIDDQNRIMVRTSMDGTVKRTALSPGTWTWRPQAVAGATPRTTELPYAKVVLAADRNGDAVVDWQDGGIALRDHMYRPFGAEKTKGYVVSNIEYNTNSFNQHPFARALDDVKKTNLLTDGLGQLVQLKGYQAEGHDNGHPDYGGNINNGAGGKADLNMFVTEAKKYNVATGVHINAQEAYPDAKNFRWDMTKGPTATGWIYRDVSYLIDRDKDLQTGNFAARLDALKADVPGLAFIYNDVCFCRGYQGYEYARAVRERGWMAHTEFEEFIDRDALWYHRSGNYDDNGIRSQLIRFLQNTDRDVWYRKDATLLKGLSNLSYGGWMGGQTDLKAWQRMVFTNNLPTKFMQHFPIMKWTPDRIDFTGGVYSTTANGPWQLFQGDTKVAEGANMFIPWDPINQTKILHWNDAGGSTTWKLPTAWRGQSQVAMYTLTDTGRQNRVLLPVTNGQVTINATAKTAYVIDSAGTVSTPPAVDWGQGALVDDGSFNSGTLSKWSPTGSVHVETSAKGWQHARVDGNGGSISQQITGLAPGTYSLSAYARTTSGRQATLSATPSGGTTASKSFSASNVDLEDPVNVWHATRFQKTHVLFTVPSGSSSATITLSAGSGVAGSYSDFADVRVVASKAPAVAGTHYYSEDFEADDRAWGPFLNLEKVGGGNPHSHRAQRNTNYTRDTINGNFSFKSFRIPAGDVWRTSPQTLDLKPGRIYKVGFKYQSDTANQYRFQVRSGLGVTLVDEALPASSARALDSWPALTDPKPAGWTDSYPPQGDAVSNDYATVFSTGGAGCGDAHLALTSAGGNGAVTFDDLYVDDLGAAPASPCPTKGGTSVTVTPVTVVPGQAVPFSATFVNNTTSTVNNVALTPRYPSAFTPTATSPTTTASVAPGATFTVNYTVTVPAGTKIGTYWAYLQATSDYGTNQIKALENLRLVVNCAPGARCEAENATWSGAVYEDLARGQSGAGYINLNAGAGNYIEWPVQVSSAGTRTLTVGYALPGGMADRPLTLTVNGQAIASGVYPETGSWSTWSTKTYQVNLNAGVNTVRLSTATSDGPNIDWLSVG